MESISRCDTDNLVCLAGELLSRWESTARERARAATKERPKQDDDCLPCLLTELASDFDD